MNALDAHTEQQNQHCPKQSKIPGVIAIVPFGYLQYPSMSGHIQMISSAPASRTELLLKEHPEVKSLLNQHVSGECLILRHMQIFKCFAHDRIFITILPHGHSRPSLSISRMGSTTLNEVPEMGRVGLVKLQTLAGVAMDWPGLWHFEQNLATK
jgi:hypothetical protein